jgi:hypothetical protein
MVFYTNPENIKMIWKVISALQLFNDSFPDTKSKNDWFNYVIDKFSYCDDNLNTKDLVNVNRDTIAFMISDLKQKTKKVQHNQNTQSVPAREKNILIGSESDMHYQTRQKEYDSMLNRQTPPVIDFSTPPNDEPIEDMNNLLEKQMIERRKIYDFSGASPRVSIDDNNNYSQPLEIIELQPKHVNFDENKNAIQDIELFDEEQKFKSNHDLILIYYKVTKKI